MIAQVFIYPSIHISISPSLHVSICMFLLPADLFICLLIYLAASLFNCVLAVYLFFCQPIYPSLDVDLGDVLCMRFRRTVTYPSMLVTTGKHDILLSSFSFQSSMELTRPGCKDALSYCKGGSGAFRKTFWILQDTHTQVLQHSTCPATLSPRV